MWYVYVIKSKEREFMYIGSTNDLNRRITEYDNGLSLSTKAYRPFEMLCYVAVRTEEQARSLERYFKTGSGKAILYKRIVQRENI